MSNLLELVEGKECAAVAAPYENIKDRKEIYIKSLIVSALKGNMDFIKTEDSLFYSKRFYEHARLFDFYINNNVFDLIVLKPDSNELLFEEINDDIHSNIYGYLVVRISSDSKRAEILGYFMSKDFTKIINNGVVDVEALKNTNTLKDIDTIESQMSIDDVSERFFELMSQFLDGDITLPDISELSCLLYNSTELRQVFAEIGRFDKLCADIQDNQELLQDDFLNVLSGSRDESEEDEAEAFMLDDLVDSDDEEQPELQTEDIELGFDLSAFEQAEEVQISEEEQTDIDLANLIETASEQSEVEPESELEAEMLLETTDSDTIIDLETEQVVADETSIESDADNKKEAEILKDDEAELETFELNLEDLNEAEELSVSPNEEGAVLDDIEVAERTEESLNGELVTDSDNLLTDNDLLEQGETSDKSYLDNGLDLDFDELDLDNLEGIDEAKNSSQPDEQGSNLAAELSALSNKKQDTTEMDEAVTKFEKVEEVEAVEEPGAIENLEAVSFDVSSEQSVELEKLDEEAEEKFAKVSDVEGIEEDVPEDTLIEEPVVMSAEEHVEKPHAQDNEHPQTIADEELMSILNEEPDEDVIIDDAEFLSILGIEETADLAVADTHSVNINESKMPSISDEQSLVGSEEMLSKASSEKAEDAGAAEANDSELQVLYSAENTATTGIFSGDSIINIASKHLPKTLSNQRTIIVAAVLALFVVSGSVALMMNKGSNSNNDVVSGVAQNDNPVPADNFSLPTTPQDIDSNNEPPLDAQTTAQSIDSTAGDTKIVSSLSRQAGAAPVILKSVAWQVPASMTSDTVFSKYLQIAGKNIKLNLAADLLDTNDFAYNNKIKVSMTVKNNSPVKNVKILESSGSKAVDDIVLQSIKQTLKYINSPVMSVDTGDKDVVLVISI